jgi:hypothetical protein
MGCEIEVKAGGLELEIKGWRGLVTLAALMMLGAAVVQELRLPPERRTRHGALFGFIPYDLRPPTPERVARTLWNPEEGRVLVPTAFGVGWSINAAAVARLVGGGAGQAPA